MVGRKAFENFSWRETELARPGIYKIGWDILDFALKVGLHFNTPTLFRSIGNKEFPQTLCRSL